jgi:dienelactone hydrolase
MRSSVLTALALVLTATAANAAVKEQPVSYQDGQTTLKGFVVYDDAQSGKRPGIVMVPEWWGITKHTHTEAAKFAQQGYTVFLADMYGDGKSVDTPSDAGTLATAVMKAPATMESRFNAAKAQLAQNPTVDPARIGAIGYCFGGAVVLNMARLGSDLGAVAGFHASLGVNTPPPAPGSVKAKILVLNGADDPLVKKEEYAQFEKELGAAKADYRVVQYPGAVHAFTNPEATEIGKKFNLPLRYDAKADEQATAEAMKLFKATLQN